MNKVKFVKPGFENETPNTKESAKKRQDIIDEQKAVFFLKGGKVTIL